MFPVHLRLVGLLTLSASLIGPTSARPLDTNTTISISSTSTSSLSTLSDAHPASCPFTLECQDASNDNLPTLYSTQLDAHAAYSVFCNLGCTMALPSPPSTANPATWLPGRGKAALTARREYCNLEKREEEVVWKEGKEGGRVWSEEERQRADKVVKRDWDTRKVGRAWFRVCCRDAEGGDWAVKAAELAGFSLSKCYRIGAS